MWTIALKSPRVWRGIIDGLFLICTADAVVDFVKRRRKKGNGNEATGKNLSGSSESNSDATHD